MDELLLGVLASAVGRDVGDRALEQLQKRLLHALARNVARDRGVLTAAGDLVDLVDVDDAALRAFDVKIRRLQQLKDDVLHVLADVAGLGERGGVGDGKGHVEHLGHGLGKKRLAAARRADEQDIALLQLHLVLRGMQDAFVVVVYRNGEHDLRPLLPDDVFVELRLDLAGLGQLFQFERQAVVALGRRSGKIADDAGAHAHALVADIAAVAGDQTVRQRLRFAAKGAADAFSVFISRHNGYSFKKERKGGNLRKFPPSRDFLNACR